MKNDAIEQHERGDVLAETVFQTAGECRRISAKALLRGMSAVNSEQCN